MYEDRVIAFIDLLGFGGLVERSALEDGLPERIFTALTSMQPENIDEEAYGSVNLELCPPEEVENVREALKMMTQNIKKMHPVRISYFSDCLAFSACSDDVIASQTILDILAKLSIKLWVEHSLLVRGGIAVGMLVHVEGGPFFGPAMNCAYHLESKKAIYPRVLIDANCLAKYRTVETFDLFESLFQSDGNLHYMSLGTAYRHVINDSSLALAGEAVIGKFRKSLAETTERLRSLESGFDDDKIKEKYRWLIEDVANVSRRYVSPNKPILSDKSMLSCLLRKTQKPRQ